MNFAVSVHSTMDNEGSDSVSGFNIPPKRPKEGCFDCNILDWDLTKLPDTADLITNDDAFPIKLQKQILNECSSQDVFESSVSQDFVDQTEAIMNSTPCSRQFTANTPNILPIYSTI